MSTTKQLAITIQSHPARPARPAVWSKNVEPHASKPPSQAGKKAWAGWHEKEEEHQRKHSKLISPAVEAVPATFSFTGWFNETLEAYIAQCIIATFGVNPEDYPSKVVVEYDPANLSQIFPAQAV